MQKLSLEEQLDFIRENPSDVGKIENLFEETCLELVKMYPRQIKHIPHKNLTEKICLTAVKEYGIVIENIPIEHRTLKVCLEAAKNNFHAMLYIPKQYLTKKVYLDIIKNNPYTIKYIDKDKQTEELCLEAVKESPDSFKYIHKDNRTYNVCLEAVKRYGEAFIYVPKEHRTEELCLKAVRDEGKLINYIKNKSEKVCLYAFLNDYDLIDREYIKDKINDFIQKENKLENIVFFTNECVDSIRKSMYLLEKFNDYNKYEQIRLDRRSLDYLRNYLIDKNNNNHYILEDTIDIELFKKIAISNNELIITNTGNVNEIHKKIADMII